VSSEPVANCGDDTPEAADEGVGGAFAYDAATNAAAGVIPPTVLVLVDDVVEGKIPLPVVA
jgi:hypothetical protein